MKLSKINLLIIHGIFGFVLTKSPSLSTYYGLFIILLGTYFILGKPDPKEKYPFIFSAYIVGLEVLLRMAGASLFWEFGKYAVIYFLILGLIRKNKKIQIFSPLLLYFLLLLPAILYVPLDSLNLWRQDVAFNLSGPAALTLSSIYFFNKRVKRKILNQVLFYMILPIVSMAIYNLFTMPDLSTYQFLPYSDFYTSGGFGPNQVSTIFGLGIIGLFTAQVLGYNLTGSKYIDLLVLIIFFGLGLITFSRGGILAAIISSILAITYYLFYNQKKMYMILKGFGLLLVSVTAWVIIVSITDGIISQRYGVGKSEYGERLILDLTGRALIYEIDLNIFYDNIITGVGPGQAFKLREKYGYGKQIAAHTEYSRMLAEHGILGLISLIILIAVSIFHLSKYDSVLNKFIKIIFVILALITMGHSAMRLVMPSFIYGFLFSKYEDS